jgi:hypothetical protein
MRKLALMVCLTLLIFTSCKKEVIINPDACSILDSIPTNLTPRQQGEWLQKNVTTFTPAYYECVAGRHTITEEQFNNDTARYWNNRTPEQAANPNFKQFTSISLKDINLLNTCGCYDTYVGFRTDINNNITLEALQYFTIARTCYSLPLFRGVGLVNGLKNTDTIEFAWATKVISGNQFDFIYFRAKNKNNSNIYNYYDVSDDPGAGMNGPLMDQSSPF